MSNLRLKPGNNFVPMGMPFIDARTGKSFDGYERSIDGAVAMIIEHRKRNPRSYPANEGQWFSPSLVRQEFLRHIQTKAPQLLVNGGGAPVATMTAEGLPDKCVCGGTSFSPEYCKTCGSGQRISGYKCDSCGKIKAA